MSRRIYTRTPLMDRVFDRVVEDAGCWVFTGARSGGYGTIGLGGRGGKTVYVHRVTYEHFMAPIPEGLDLDHLCRNRACCNPWHLEPVTHRVNILRCDSPGVRAHLLNQCTRGHELTPENAYKRRNGRRDCRACRTLLRNAS